MGPCIYWPWHGDVRRALCVVQVMPAGNARLASRHGGLALTRHAGRGSCPRLSVLVLMVCVGRVRVRVIWTYGKAGAGLFYIFVYGTVPDGCRRRAPLKALR